MALPERVRIGSALRHLWLAHLTCALQVTRKDRNLDFSWEPCAAEGEMIPIAGRVRFGYGLAWTESRLIEGDVCNVASFGGADPAPGIRKECECSSGGEGIDDARMRPDLGDMWVQCASEGGECTCAGRVRFGAGARWVATEAPRTGLRAPQKTSCQAASFGGSDPYFSMKKECWCEQTSKTARPIAKVAIVLVSRKPPDLATWVKYHLDYAGVDHIFLQIEDTPEFKSLYEALSPSRRSRITMWSSAEEAATTSSANDVGKRPQDDYSTLQARQVATMSRARKIAQETGIDWLVHIDDDELLYVPTHRKVGEVLAALPTLYRQAYVPNVEALYKDATVKNCFAETSSVNTNPYAFVSYANGKSAVRVGKAGGDDLVPAGPHQWKSATGLDVSSVHLDREPFGAPLLVVHFESCPFTRWEDKFWELGNTSPDKIKGIPFPFYRDSISRFQLCDRLKMKPGVKLDPQCSQEALQELWSHYKTKANRLIRRQDVMPINIPWKSILAAQL